MKDFAVATLTPITLAHPGLAIATARAGGIALLDAGFCADAEIPRALGHLRRLRELAPADALIGLRLRAGQIAALAPLLDGFAGRDHILILADGAPSRADLEQLPASPGRRIWLEVTAVEQATRLEVPVQGLLARGQECGGFVGADPAFILAQKLAAADLEIPFYVQGGIGVHSAAACRVAGAAGVVLDDPLWLMPESPLPARWRQHLQEVDGQETSALGGDLGAPCRVFFRRDLGGARDLQRLEEELIREAGGLEERRLRWRRAAEERLGWGPPQESAWPMGQAVALAGLYRDRYRTTGRLIQAVREASRGHVAAALEHAPLAPGSPLAKSHGTLYPLVQGPMTRVSDTPAFAEAIADAGALPLLALAQMREATVRDMLRDTRGRLGDRPWGVGILGYASAERREEQLAAIAGAQPPFALIAGGRPDQAAALESRGVATYLHVPVPGLLRRFLDQGARRFVFEGRECGGHIGPLSSFALWEVMVETLLAHAPAKEFDKLHVLFAGGIHDALSAAMVSALAAPLAERGARIGAILGTAYLFTEEAVTSGALSESYQREALECADTVELKTGLGHVIRCAPTPFAAEFHEVRQRLIRESAPAETIREVLDNLGLGRARIAAKGLARAGDGELVPVEAERQRRDGMYMMGRLATLRRSVSTMTELHADVAEKSREVLAAAADAGLPARAPRTQPAQIAIVGIGSLLPGAKDPETFWRNLLRKTEVVTEVPPHRWDWRVLYSPDPKAPDKTLTKWGGFFDEVPFDPLRYGIPPNSMKSLSTSQLLALEVARWAFSDAGYEAGDFDRENTSVIIGTGANGDLEQHYLIRTALPFIVENPPEEVWKRLPEWTEESFAGVLANVTAGRVANRFDLGGANYTVDAACASSLTVIDLAISELRTGRSNMVVAVGLDFEQTPYFYQGFSRVQAVSPRGEARTFDQDADGIVISEGTVVLLLKRLADAERDGDKIYAVIQSAAGSSDGKGLGMTAPRPTGQRRALRRAYEEAGCSPASIGMYEAHGTGTPVGDRAELETIVTTLEEAGAAPKSCAIGSVKSLIGHTKAAAGMVGLAKAALALHYRTLPPHAHVDRPLAAISDPQSPVYLLREARPWLEPADGEPRRAGVSAFGFGGTNFHAVVEEYRGRLEMQAPGEDLWPWELFVLRAAGRDGLVAELRRLADALAGGTHPRLADLAYTLLLRAEERRALPAVLTLVADSAERLRGIAATVAQRLEAGEADPVGPNGHLAWEVASGPAPVAFLFPGQGSQAPDMGREAALYLPELRDALELAERVTAGRFDRPLSQIVFPPSAFTEEEEAAQRRHIDDTHAAQPAIGALSAGFLDLAGRLGLTPAMAAGHSFGELTALHAAGVLTREDFLRLAETRGRLMAPAEGGEAGAMAAVQLSAGEVLAHLSEEDGVVIANRNAPDQSVISGPAAAVAAVTARLEAAGARVRPVPVSGAFHSPLMATAEGPLVEAIAECPLAAPVIPVYGNATAAPYPADIAGLRGQLSTHLRSAVDFVGQVRRMYADGARVFVELGPGRVLTTLAGRILGEEPHTAVAFDAGGGLKGLLQSVGKLMSAGVEVDLQALFAGRQVRRLDLEEIARPVALPASVWMVDGGRVRRPNEKAGTMGQLPLLNAETIERSRREAEETKRREIAAAAAAQAPPPVAAPAPPQSGAVALEAYRAYQETMRQFLALQENVMARVLGGQTAAAVPAFQPAPAVQPLPAFVPPPAPLPTPPAPQAITAAGGNGHHDGNGNGRHPEPPKAAEPTPAAPEPAATVDRGRLTATVVSLVSERTGYPAEMLDLQQDIEADLGIDSIKRIEILDAFKRNLPDPLRAATDGHMEKLVREKSLSGWVDTVMSLAAESAESLPATQPSNGKANGNGNGHHAPEPREEEPCPRYVIRARFEELEDRDAIRPEGLFLITEDGLGVAPLVAEALRQRGVPAGVIERAALADPAEIEQTVLGLMDRHGPVQGLVHLAPLAPEDDPQSLDHWRRRTQLEVKSLFDLLRLAGPGFEGRAAAGEPCVLGATLLGGTWGRTGDSGPGSPASGGIYGVLKTLTTEHPGVHARAVDFDGSLDAGRMADIVLRELLSRGDDFEIGYPRGRRTVFAPHVEPLAPLAPGADVTDLLPQAGWVVLVTGGARGITAELAQRLAVPGARMVVVGRSPLPDEEEPGMAGLSDAAAIRRHLLERARAAGETVTPAAVEERVRAVLRRQEMRRNLAVLRQRGVEVEYVATDASSPDGLSRVIEEIYARHGRLDAVLHGAGIIEDRLLRDKTRDSFERVFDTKADSTFLLSRVLRPESLRWVVLMSSISGRIGNRGQVDYAAANEVMNRLAWEMSRRLPATRVLAINWGPWSGAGMATDGVIRELESRGIRPIGLEEGWRFLRNELAGPRGVVEVIAGSGA